MNPFSTTTMRFRSIKATFFCIGFLMAPVIHSQTLLLGYSQNPHLRDSAIHVSIGGGITFSAVNMGIEPIGEIKKGYNGRLAIRFKRRIGIIAEYTDLVKHDAFPAWGSIHARNFDLNLAYMYLTVAQSNTKFYGLIGACLQQWKAVYQGTPAFDRDIYDYTGGNQYAFNWVSMNLGLGFERYYQYFGVFGEFKFRFGRDYQSDSFAIMDASITLGVKKNLFTISNTAMRDQSYSRINKLLSGREQSRDKNHKLRIKPRIYHWF